jgi:hypothetical protein
MAASVPCSSKAAVPLSAPLLPLGSQAPTVPSWREPARHAGRVLGKPQRPANVKNLKIRGIKVPDLHVDTIKAKAREFREACRCACSALNVSSAWPRSRLAPAIQGYKRQNPPVYSAACAN